MGGEPTTSELTPTLSMGDRRFSPPPRTHATAIARGYFHAWIPPKFVAKSYRRSQLSPGLVCRDRIPSLEGSRANPSTFSLSHGNELVLKSVFAEKTNSIHPYKIAAKIAPPDPAFYLRSSPCRRDNLPSPSPCLYERRTRV
jgi:hypothetical protein